MRRELTFFADTQRIRTTKNGQPRPSRFYGDSSDIGALAARCGSVRASSLSTRKVPALGAPLHRMPRI